MIRFGRKMKACPNRQDPHKVGQSYTLTVEMPNERNTKARNGSVLAERDQVGYHRKVSSLVSSLNATRGTSSETFSVLLNPD